MNNTDYYKTLEIDRSANTIDIKNAYRKLAFRYHPDRNAHNSKVAEEKFKLIAQAYEVLGDPEKRREYDCNTLSGIENRNNISKYTKELIFFKAGGLIISIIFIILFFLYLVVPLINAILNGLIFAGGFYIIASEHFIDEKIYNKKEYIVLKVCFGFLAILIMTATIYLLKDPSIKRYPNRYSMLRSSKRSISRSIAPRSFPKLK